MQDFGKVHELIVKYHKGEIKSLEELGAHVLAYADFPINLTDSDVRKFMHAKGYIDVILEGQKRKTWSFMYVPQTSGHVPIRHPIWAYPFIKPEFYTRDLNVFTAQRHGFDFWHLFVKYEYPELTVKEFWDIVKQSDYPTDYIID